MIWIDRLRYTLFGKLKIEITNNLTHVKRELYYDNGELFQRNSSQVWVKIRFLKLGNSYIISTNNWWTNPSNIIPTNLKNIYIVLDSWKSTNTILVNGRVYK